MEAKETNEKKESKTKHYRCIMLFLFYFYFLLFFSFSKSKNEFAWRGAQPNVAYCSRVQRHAFTRAWRRRCGGECRILSMGSERGREWCARWYSMKLREFRLIGLPHLRRVHDHRVGKRRATHEGMYICIYLVVNMVGGMTESIDDARWRAKRPGVLVISFSL